MTTGIRPLDRAVPGLPGELTALVMRMLTIERDDRPDLPQVRNVFERFAGARSTALPSTPPAPARPTASSLRRPAMVAVAAGTLAIAAVVAWRLALPQRSSGAAAAAAARPYTGGSMASCSLALPAPGPSWAGGVPGGAIALVAQATSSAHTSPSTPAPASPTLPAKVIAPAAASATPPFVVAGTPIAPTAAATAPGPDCDPPYEFDSHGRKTWKRECL
jgi:hypothetical protein